MKPERMYLDQLTEKTKAYKVKVKVIEKGPERSSPSKGILFQGLVMEDDKGNKMRAALSGNQIEVYKEAITHLGSYEIANASIKPSDEQWRSKDAKYGLLGYQMSFGSQTVIQRINAEAGPILQEYQCLATIPRVYDPTDRFDYTATLCTIARSFYVRLLLLISIASLFADIVAVVLYLEEEARTVTGYQQREYLVREILVTDHSNEQPMTISVWNEMTGKHCKPLSSWAEQFSVFGFTALRGTNHRGFSLVSTMSTQIIADPKGDRPDALREWVKTHNDWLSDRQAMVLDVRNPSKEKVFITLDSLKLKRPYNTLQERHWLRVIIPDPQLSKINAYLGCSACGRRGDIAVGTTYACTKFLKTDVVSTPKITYNFVASDGTGTIECTSFTKDSEKLFRMTAADAFRMRHSDGEATFEQLKELLQTTYFLLEIGPTVGLSKNGVLEWCLKSVALEPEGGFEEHAAHLVANQNPQQDELADPLLAQMPIATTQQSETQPRHVHRPQPLQTQPTLPADQQPGHVHSAGMLPAQTTPASQRLQPAILHEQATLTNQIAAQGPLTRQKRKHTVMANPQPIQGMLGTSHANQKVADEQEIEADGEHSDSSEQ